MGTQRTRESAVPAHRGDHRRRAHFSRFGEIDIRYLIWGAVGYSPQSRHFSILGGVFLASITTVRLPQDVNILPRVMKGLGGKVLLETYRAWGRATWELRAFLIEAAKTPFSNPLLNGDCSYSDQCASGFRNAACLGVVVSSRVVKCCAQDATGCTPSTHSGLDKNAQTPTADAHYIHR